MASNSETGHAKNVANFEKIIAFLVSYGATFAPSKTAIKLPTLKRSLQLRFPISTPIHFHTPSKKKFARFKNFLNLFP